MRRRPLLPASRGLSLIELMIVLGIIGLICSLLLPAVQDTREAARRAECLHRMRQVAIAIEHYHGQFGSFPLVIGKSTHPGRQSVQYLYYHGLKEHH